MTASLSGVFSTQQFTDAGLPAASYRLYTYAASTTTQKTAYTDATAAVPHTYTADGDGGQYIALNARGELPGGLFLTSGGYDLALKTPAGATVWTRRAIGTADSVFSDLSNTSDPLLGDALVGVKSILTGGVARTQHSKNADFVSAADFGAVGDGVTDDTTAIQNALNAALDLDFGDYSKNYKISGTLAVRSNSTLRFNKSRMFQSTLQTPLLDVKNKNGVTITGGNFTGVAMSVVTAGDFVIGRKYTIVTPGTTNFVALGASANTAGTYFTATGAGSGTGTASTFYNRPASQDICIAGDYATNLRVYDNTFTGFAYSPLMVAFWGTNIWFEGNTVTGPGATTLNPLGGDPAVTGFRNNTGATVLGYGVFIRGNTFSETSQGLIVGQQSRDVSIANNAITNTRVEHGMYVDAGCKHVTIAQNHVSNAVLIGIKVQWYDAITDVPADVTITGNTVEACGGDGIIVLNAAQDTIATLTGVTQANPGVFTTAANHGLVVNDVINITGVLGMTPVNAMYVVATTPTAATFTVKVVGTALDTTAFPAYVSGGSISRPVFCKTLVMVGNTLRNIGQDAIGVRFVVGGTIAENSVDTAGRFGIYQLYGRSLDTNNNSVMNTQQSGVYCLSPVELCAICDNTLINTGAAGIDLNGGSSGIAVEGDAGVEVGQNTITGAEAVQVATISGITQANPGVITTSAAHGLSSGQTITIAGVVGMTAVNITTQVFGVLSPTTFTIGTSAAVDTTAYGAYVSGGVITLVKMQYGVYVLAGDKRNYSVRNNTVTRARDAGARFHMDDLHSLAYVDGNVFKAIGGENVIVDLPTTTPGRGHPFPQHYGTGAPASGNWVQGTRIGVLYPAEGTPSGYVCVASGTPGTWRPFGPVQSVNAYTVTNPATDRALNVTGDTLAQVAAVLGTLIADLQSSGVLK